MSIRAWTRALRLCLHVHFMCSQLVRDINADLRSEIYWENERCFESATCYRRLNSLPQARDSGNARYPIALTGAGMSVESGIPPFRGPGGLWTKYGEPPMNGYQIFIADPKKAWEERISRQNDELWGRLRLPSRIPVTPRSPNSRPMGILRFLITQNVDDLHRQAGQSALAEIHGNWKLDSLYRMRKALSR